MLYLQVSLALQSGPDRVRYGISLSRYCYGRLSASPPHFDILSSRSAHILDQKPLKVRFTNMARWHPPFRATTLSQNRSNELLPPTPTHPYFVCLTSHFIFLSKDNRKSKSRPAISSCMRLLRHHPPMIAPVGILLRCFFAR